MHKQTSHKFIKRPVLTNLHKICHTHRKCHFTVLTSSPTHPPSTCRGPWWCLVLKTSSPTHRPYPPVEGHDGCLHHVPGWPNDVPCVWRATPREHGEEGMVGTILVQRPVSEVHYHLQVWHMNLGWDNQGMRDKILYSWKFSLDKTFIEPSYLVLQKYTGSV